MRAASFRPRVGAWLLTVTLGCASGEGARRTETPVTASTSQQASARPPAGAVSACPMELPGVQVDAEDTAGGAAVRFSFQEQQRVDPRRVEELRASVRDMVARHQAGAQATALGQSQVEAPAHRCAACPTLPPVMVPPPGLGPGAGVGGAGMESVELPAAQLQVQDTVDGARVLYVPQDPAQLGALRDAVQSLGVQIESGECPMLGGAGR